jgi:hypothetical protein
MTQKVLRARRRGTVYPYELVPMLIRAPQVRGAAETAGSFVEHDLDDHGRLVAVDRRHGANTASIVVDLVTTPNERYPEGMTRVALLSDPTKGLGSLAEAECRRVVAALDLAEERGVPVEWFAVSSGARIAMDSGTENMDSVGRVLRRIVEFTQAGGEINVIVTGINVGAQPYWNAEATMLMHTKGILVMTPDSAMVLTGKQALDYSGGVSAEDNYGIGGYDRIMGPNGQAQYWAPDVAGACEILFRHYDLTYVVPGDPARALLFKAILDEIEAHSLVEKTAEVGQYLYNGLENLSQKYPGDILNLRGKERGTFLAFDSPRRDEVLRLTLEKGVNMGGSGDTSIRLRPMLIFQKCHGEFIKGPDEALCALANRMTADILLDVLECTFRR